jgi:hypothetical protein
VTGQFKEHFSIQSDGTSTRFHAGWAAFDADWREPERRRQSLATWAMLWSVIVVVELALHFVVPHSALRASDLPAGARFLLLCYSLTVLTLFSILPGAVIKFARTSLVRLVPARLIALWFGRGCTVLAVWLVLILYGASWGLFWQTGSFIDSQVFIFLAPHPLQVIHWVDLDVALVIIAASGAVTFVVVHWVPRPATMAKLSTSTVLHHTRVRFMTRS